MDRHVIITIKVVLTATILLFALWLLYRLAPIFAILFISMFVVLAVEPAVKFFKQKAFMNKPLSRGASVALTYVLLILAIIFILTIGLPPVISQAQKLLGNLTTVLKSIPGLEESEVSIRDVIPSLTNVSEGLVATTFSVFSNVLAVVSVLFLSLYMSLDWENIKKRFSEFFPGERGHAVSNLFAEVELNIGYWVRGQLLLMLVVGLTSFFGLLLLGVDYPLALGLISGLLEIVPVLGPVISAVLAAVVGFAASPIKGFGVVILYLLIQQLENNFLVPKIMQKVSGFSPLVVLIALLVGSNLFGAVGAIVAIPLTMILVLIVKKILLQQK